MVPVDEQKFIQNPVIQQLMPLHVWTVNNRDPNKFHGKLKAPLDPYALINHNLEIGFHKNSQHATYDELKNLPYVKALSSNVLQTHVLAIDLEAKTIENQNDGDFCQEVFEHVQHDCFANYVEQSVHGGEHRLLEIPDELLSDPTYQPLFHTNVIKLPQKTLEVFPSGLHHMTLTKRIVAYQTADVHSRAYLKRTAAFLDWLLPYVHVKKEHSVNLNKIDSDDPFVKDFVKYAEQRMNFTQLSQKYANRLDDRSRYDYTLCCSMWGKIDTIYQELAQNSMRTMIFPNFVDQPTITQMANVVYQCMLDYFDETDLYREKLNETRNNTNYLMFIIQRAYESLPELAYRR